jgi:hypothetical protein
MQAERRYDSCCGVFGRKSGVSIGIAGRYELEGGVTGW